jgi:hypothetical protein
LVFSLLYGCEFLSNIQVLQKCEDAWWTGVRKFYGLPNGVSSVTLRLLFPKVSLIDRVICAKFNLLHRGSQPHDTIFPEAIVCDRALLLGRHRVGFSQCLREWCQFLHYDDVFDAERMTDVRARLTAVRGVRREGHWSQFSSMPSTAHAASLFATPAALHSTVLAASKFGLLGVRVALLALTGSLSVSYTKSRGCICGEQFSFAHFLSCATLGPCRTQSLRLAVEREDWRGAASLLLSRFEVFIHAFRGGELSAEESDLFEQLAKDAEVSE